MKNFVAWLLLIALALAVTPTRAQIIPGPPPLPPAPCNAQITNACNPSPGPYYSPATGATPVVMASASSVPQANIQGKYSEAANPAYSTMIDTVGMTGTTGAWQPELLQYNTATRTVNAGAIVMTLNCATTGQAHDDATITDGSFGDFPIFGGAISAQGRYVAGNGCSSSKNMCSDSHCQQGSGTAQYSALPMKIVMPTASPAAVASSTQYYAPFPDDPSELYAPCVRILPGDPNTWAGETRRCFLGGQAQNSIYPLNGTTNINVGLMQVGGIMHEGSTAGSFYFDTINCFGWTGSACGTPGANNCPGSGTNSTGGAVAAMAACYDPVNEAIGSATTGAMKWNVPATDNVWRVYQITAITASTSGSWSLPTLPSNGEPNAGTSCTMSGNTGTETIQQFAIDIANGFNGNTNNGSTTQTMTSNCTGWRTSYRVDASPNNGTGTYHYTGSNGYALTCTSSAPCLIFSLQPTASGYSSTLDLQTSNFMLNLPGASTCATFCTASASMGQNTDHNTVGNCRALPTLGDEILCLYDIDHLTRGPFTTTSQAVTSLGQALMLGCANLRTDYHVAIPATMTMHPCASANSGTSFTISAGNGISSSNPANIMSPGLPQGTGLSATAQSPWLMGNPTTTTGTWIQFDLDWSGFSDPYIINSSAIPLRGSWDGTNMDDGNFLIGMVQASPSVGPIIQNCVYNTTTGATDRCDQLDVSAAFGPSCTTTCNNYALSVGLFTGFSGTLYEFVMAGDASAHSCPNVCAFEYTAAPTSGETLTWTYQGLVHPCTSTAAQAAPGTVAADDSGGYHAYMWSLCGSFTASANTTSIYMGDNLLP